MTATQIAMPFLASVSALSLALYAVQFRQRPGGVPQTVFLLVLSLCALANGVEAVLADPNAKMLARHVATQVYWFYNLLVLWILTRMMPRLNAIGSWQYLVIGAPLLLASVFTLSNHWHGWMWSDTQVVSAQVFKTFTPLGLALRWYTLLLLALIVAVGMLHARKLAAQWRRHIYWLLFGFSMPLWLAALKMALPSTSMVQTLPTSVAFLPACLAILLGLWQHQLIGFGPLARDRMFNILPDGILVVDHRCRVVDANQTLHTLLRLPRNLGDCRARHLLKRYPDWYEAVREQRDDHTLIRIAGRDYEVAIRSMKSQGHTNTLSTVRDVTETQDLLRRLEEQSQRDSLTGAPNRRAMMSEYSQLRERKPDMSVGMMIIDLDDFKRVNDRFGHQAGDDALVLTVNRLQRQLRPDDLFCRMGGEEFVIVMHDIDAGTLWQRADAIRADISKYVTVDQGYHVTASIGLAHSPVVVPFEMLFKVADERLYLSKHMGKNRVTAAKDGGESSSGNAGLHCTAQ